MAGKQRAEDEHDRSMTLAWHIEALHRQKKLPELQKLLTKRKQRPQTPQEQMLVMKTLSAQLGIPLRRVTRGR